MGHRELEDAGGRGRRCATAGRHPGRFPPRGWGGYRCALRWTADPRLGEEDLGQAQQGRNFPRGRSGKGARDEGGGRAEACTGIAIDHEEVILLVFMNTWKTCLC